jgi:uncharacterized RDD family membrane protein YckC
MRMEPNTPPTARPAHLGWRLLAMTYDFFPVLALWFAASGLLLLVRAGQPVEPGSVASALGLVWLWLASGAYAVLSWRRGGQTLGMRPWRLKVTAADGRRAGLGALSLRYAVATLSLAAFGLGFLWSLLDRERRTLHDLASRTVLVRLQPPA